MNAFIRRRDGLRSSLAIASTLLASACTLLHHREAGPSLPSGIDPCTVATTTEIGHAVDDEFGTTSRTTNPPNGCAYVVAHGAKSVRSRSVRVYIYTARGDFDHAKSRECLFATKPVTGIGVDGTDCAAALFVWLDNNRGFQVGYEGGAVDKRLAVARLVAPRIAAMPL